MGVNLPPSVSYPKGTILVMAGANTNDVQVITIGGSPTGGTFTITGTHAGITQVTSALAYNATAATVQTALQALSIFGPNVTVSGSAGGPYTITFSGGLANTPMIALTAQIAGLTGGSPTVSYTHTVGQSSGTFTQYTGTTSVATPTTAPTLTATGSAGTIGAGTYVVQYTYVTQYGETQLSPGAPVTLTSAQSIQVTSITGLPTGVTNVNFYVDGDKVLSNTPTSGATGTVTISAISPTLGGSPPYDNTANPRPICITEYDATTDSEGNITLGLQTGGGQWGETVVSLPAFFEGEFSVTDLVNLDNNAIVAWRGARLLSGSVSGPGVLHIG